MGRESETRVQRASSRGGLAGFRILPNTPERPAALRDISFLLSQRKSQVVPWGTLNLPGPGAYRDGQHGVDIGSVRSNQRVLLGLDPLWQRTGPS